MGTGDSNDENPDILSIQFEDGTFTVMPYKVYGYIEREVERIATDPDAIDFLSLSRIGDPPTLALLSDGTVRKPVRIRFEEGEGELRRALPVREYSRRLLGDGEGQDCRGR